MLPSGNFFGEHLLSVNVFSFFLFIYLEVVLGLQNSRSTITLYQHIKNIILIFCFHHGC